MNSLRPLLLAALLALGLAVTARAQGYERNFWPVAVQEVDATGKVDSWTGAGPLLFYGRPAHEGGTWSGLHPLWIQRRNEQGDFRSAHFLYPVFSYEVDLNTYKWNFFELIRGSGIRPGGTPPATSHEKRGEFEIWPIWFSRKTGDPAFDYWGLFPIYGTTRGKLTLERFSWFLFPVYAQSESRGAVTTSLPWPILRRTTGAAHGWAVWPLYSTVERPGVSHFRIFLWPLGYNHLRQPHPQDPPGTPPRHDFGFLPFYAKSTGPGLIGETFIWPFFGYTDRTLPTRYHETRYLYPFLVQGRGEDHYVNRWGPIYTHSISKGVDKTWYLWPLVRQLRWTEPERDIAHEKTQLLYFLYWSEGQSSISRPHAATAHLTHLWPIFSSWNNGAGQRQFQALSPLDPLFHNNEKIRNAWSPLFALVRYDQRTPEDTSTSLLWNLVTWERRDAEARREFHLGPLYSQRSVGEQKRVAFISGLFGFQREGAGSGWRMFWLDFRAKSATTPAPASP